MTDSRLLGLSPTRPKRTRFLLISIKILGENSELRPILVLSAREASVSFSQSLTSVLI